MSVYGAGQKYASIDTGGSRNQTIVSAVPGKIIKVMSYVLQFTLADGAQWKSGSTAISGVMSFQQGGGINCHYCPLGLFKTASGSALNIVLTTGGAPVTGHLVYVLE